MSSIIGDKCPICKAKARVLIEENDDIFVECSSCGRYNFDDTYYAKKIEHSVYKDRIASYFYYNNKVRHPIPESRFFYYIGEKDSYEECHNQYPYCHHLTKDVVDIWYPNSFSEKVDTFLLGLAARTNFMGEPVIFTQEQLESACFIQRTPKGPMGNLSNVKDKQKEYFIDFLTEQKYVEVDNITCTLLPDGYERVDKLQKSISEKSKTAFVAMSFSSDMQEVRDAIKEAITKCGFIPRIMDEIEHNNQIVPEMLYEIRNARFIVAELTNHNNGAYFEAGYALGIGREVIQVCKKSTFGTDGHFDVKQVNSVLWENCDDLTERLVSRIQATIV